MSIFKSAFEKLSLQNQESIRQSSAYVANAVSPEGSLFGIFVNMENYLKKIAENTDPSKSKAAKIDAKGAKALGTAMPGIGKGFMLIAEALNMIPDGKDAEAKDAGNHWRYRCTERPRYGHFQVRWHACTIFTITYIGYTCASYSNTYGPSCRRSVLLIR